MIISQNVFVPSILLNKYMIFTGICYALSTPLGVHIGYLMGQDNWTMVFIELAILIVIHILAPIMWVKAQTLDLKENAPRTKDDGSRGTTPPSKDG